MDSFELNKLIGAVLGTVFILFSVSIVSDAIFHHETPEQPGFIIQAAEAGDGGGESAEDTGPEPIGPMLASADPADGEKVYKKCAACHTPEEGGANKVGPNLWDIVNRPIASHDGFSYSGAMQEFAQGGSVVWDYEHLNQFLLAPKKYIKGTAMGFAGLKKDQDRADVIAYLRTLSSNPAPLPEAAAEGGGAEGDAAPEAEGNDGGGDGGDGGGDSSSTE